MTADTVGGVWDYALTLTQALAPLDVEVVLAVMGPAPSMSQRQAARLDNLVVHTADVRLEWMDDCWAEVERADAWLLELDKALRPNLVHINGYAHAALPWQAPVVVGAHSCVWSWWKAVRAQAPPAKFMRYRQAARRGIMKAACVVAPTHMMLEAITRHYTHPQDAQVIPNGRNANAYAPGPKEPFILAVGRLWDEAKNIRALAGIAPDLPWPVRIAGERRSPQGGSASFDTLKGLGRLSHAQLKDEYARASIFAAPAYYEPFGLAILEAALSGCALVLGDIPSLREVWGETAFYVSPYDTAALLSALNTLIENAALREQYAHAARTRAQRYTDTRMAQAYHRLYRTLLRAPAVSRRAAVTHAGLGLQTQSPVS